MCCCTHFHIYMLLYAIARNFGNRIVLAGKLISDLRRAGFCFIL